MAEHSQISCHVCRKPAVAAVNMTGDDVSRMEWVCNDHMPGRYSAATENDTLLSRLSAAEAERDEARERMAEMRNNFDAMAMDFAETKVSFDVARERLARFEAAGADILEVSGNENMSQAGRLLRIAAACREALGGEKK